MPHLVEIVPQSGRVVPLKIGYLAFLAGEGHVR